MKFTAVFASPLLALALGGMTSTASAVSFSEGFDTAGAIPSGWVTTNLSTNSSSGRLWDTRTQIGLEAPYVNPYEGSAFAVASFQSIGTGIGTINNWLISPTITGLKNGDTFSFYTTTTPVSNGSIPIPDRLEFRLSTSGSSTDVGVTDTSVGAFTTTLATVNPDLTGTGYPDHWTEITATVSGLAGPVDGRVAFRYFVTDGGPFGLNSNIIGVDSFNYAAAAVPEPESCALMAVGLASMLVLRRRSSAVGADRTLTSRAG